MDMISIFDISKLLFSICIRNTGMSGDGGRNTFDIYEVYRKFNIPMRIETFGTISNTGIK